MVISIQNYSFRRQRQFSLLLATVVMFFVGCRMSGGIGELEQTATRQTRLTMEGVVGAECPPEELKNVCDLLSVGNKKCEALLDNGACQCACTSYCRESAEDCKPGYVFNEASCSCQPQECNPQILEAKCASMQTSTKTCSTNLNSCDCSCVELACELKPQHCPIDTVFDETSCECKAIDQKEEVDDVASESGGSRGDRGEGSTESSESMGGGMNSDPAGECRGARLSARCADFSAWDPNIYCEPNEFFCECACTRI